MPRFIALLLSTSLLVPPGSIAWGQAAPATETNLMISARRIELGGSKRSSELFLMNPSSKRHTYRITVNYRDMDAQGDTVERQAPKQGERPWTDLLRFSPRQITLGAGQSQTVRVAAMKPADLPPGEYRYHLTVAEMPEPAPAAQDETKEGLRITVSPLFGVTIPVIFRNGDLKAISDLAELVFQPAATNKKAALTFWLTRSGEASSYGHLKATFTPAVGAEETVAELKGIAVYTNLARRAMTLPLERPGAKPFGPGRLHLTFTPEGARRAEAQADLVLR